MLFVTTRTGKVTENLYAIRTVMVNLFLIKDGDGYICVDTGLGGGLVKLGLKRLGIDPAKVTAILLTHSDYDHAGGIGLFPNATLYLPEQEEQMINGTTARKAIRYNGPIKRQYTLLQDQQQLQVGTTTVKCIASPGHTLGSMSYLINGRWLFVGDSMALINGKVHPFPRFINMDTAAQMDTIRKLAKLSNVEMLFTAHSGYTRKFEEALRKWC